MNDAASYKIHRTPDEYSRYIGWLSTLPVKQRLNELTNHLRQHIWYMEWRKMGSSEWPRDTGKSELENARAALAIIEAVGSTPTRADLNRDGLYSGTWNADHWCETVMQIKWCWQELIKQTESEER